MKESRKEFIKEIHKNSIDYWQKRIEKEFPKLFIEDGLEIGKWYKVKRDNDTALVLNDNTNNCYGFNYANDWSEIFDLKTAKDLSRNITPATEDEVFEALKKEAIKRGFKKGCNFIHNKENYPFVTDVININKDNYCILLDENTLLLDGWSIFKDGKWAEVIETITKEEAEKQLGKIII